MCLLHVVLTLASYQDIGLKWKITRLFRFIVRMLPVFSFFHMTKAEQGLLPLKGFFTHACLVKKFNVCYSFIHMKVSIRLPIEGRSGECDIFMPLRFIEIPWIYIITYGILIKDSGLKGYHGKAHNNIKELLNCCKPILVVFCLKITLTLPYMDVVIRVSWSCNKPKQWR